MSKVRKVYNLRKTSNVRTQSQQQESRLSKGKQEGQNPLLLSDVGERNLSTISQGGREGIPKMIEQSPEEYQVEGEELVIDQLQLNFNVRLTDIERKEVRIRNIGNSAVYLQFAFKNSPKINNSGFKDPKLKFYCHYDNNVIRPGEESSFIFSFLSQFPGSFTQQVEILCQPPLKTAIPSIKLTGKAWIADSWQQKRSKFHRNLQQQILRQQIGEILSDLVDQVKLPPPPRPNVSDPKIAEVEFQRMNRHLNLYYNDYLHNWFDQLYHEICDKASIANQERYWNQSVETLKNLINTAEFLDDVEKKCFSDRLEHYCYLSMSPLPNKSQLYSTIYQYFMTAGYNLGGDYVDASRKELDMWQIPFREPKQSDTPEQLKQRKEEIEKIKAEWVKKAKKKKWGAEEQAELVNDYKKRVQAKTTENILNQFTNFEEKAEFIKAKLYIKGSTFSLQQYHKNLQRMKTAKQYPLQGKKVMIKWNLKLKDDCEQKLKQLQDYLTKKKQQQKRIQQQKKNQGGKKKKAPPKPKKKGQKDEDEQKPLVFDFSSILDEENWTGFTETFRIVLQKQPQILFIGITYGPRSGRFLSQYSVLFLLEHLKTLEPAIQFVPHEGLSAIPERIENQTLGEGSIVLLQNLNFLPFETTQQEVVTESAQGVTSISRRKLLHPQIREFFDQFNRSIDVLVTEDRFSNQISGFTAYINREVILGSLWWKYIGLSMRVQNANIVFGEDFTPENYILLSQLAKNCSKIYLSGLSGLKFYLARNNMASLGKIHLANTEKEIISAFVAELQANNQLEKIVIPNDFILQKQQGQKVVYSGGQAVQSGVITDIGPSSVKQINQISSGSLFVLGETSIQRTPGVLSTSITSLLKNLYKRQQQKRLRHSIQSGSPLGINYNQDLVVYLIGVSQSLVQRLQLKEKRVKVSQEQNEQAVEQEQEGGESDRKKIDQISDFRLSSCTCLYRLWSGKFDMGLKDIYKYEPIIDQ